MKKEQKEKKNYFTRDAICIVKKQTNKPKPKQSFERDKILYF